MRIDLLYKTNDTVVGYYQVLKNITMGVARKLIKDDKSIIYAKARWFSEWKYRYKELKKLEE